MRQGAAAASLDRAMEMAGGAGGVTLALETTAGQGHGLGYRFEHLAELLGLVRSPEEYGVCLDTCHVFAAGYDLRAADRYEETLEAFDRVIGIDRLAALHLNDSKTAFAARRDRHADLGEGKIGIRAFTRMARDSRFEGLPAVLAGWRRGRGTSRG